MDKNVEKIPHHLKASVEVLSGLSMDSVLVHYNSLMPEQIGALAYTQGTNIYLGPGQESRLPHEAWHVVQQMRGQVAPTRYIRELPVNDNVELEREANERGEEANRMSQNGDIPSSGSLTQVDPARINNIIQLFA